MTAAIMAVIGLPALAFLLYAPGAALLNVVGTRWPSRPTFSGLEEWLFTAVLFSFLFTGGTGFLLAEAGVFRWWLVLLAALLFTILLGAALGATGLRWRPLLLLLRPPAQQPQRETERRTSRIRALVLAAIILVAVGLFSRPAEMLRGSLDSGAYVNFGVAIGRTGGIIQKDPLIAQLNDAESREVLQPLNLTRYTLGALRMPGFYVLDKQDSLVLPQFYALYPVWMGLLYQFFDIWGALYTTPLLALLFVLAVYFFARRTFSRGTALIALALLVICPVTIWFARYPVSEVIMGLLAFAGFFAFARMVQLPRERASTPPPDGETAMSDISSLEEGRQAWSRVYGLIAGLSLGQMALARPDFIFFLAPVPIYLLYWWLARRWQPAYTWFATTLGAALSAYVVHFIFFGFAYTLDLYHHIIVDARRLRGPVFVALLAAILVVVAAGLLYTRLRPFWLRVESRAARYRWVWTAVIILLVGVYFLYNYAIAPWLGTPQLDKEGKPVPVAVHTTLDSYIGAPVDLGSRYNLLRIGWYLSPLGMLLGVAGLLRWIWNRLNAASGLFFGALLVAGFVFIQETYTDAHYIYTMRRYLPVILPALVLGIAWACQYVWTRIRPRPLGMALGAVAVVALGIFFIYTSRLIVPHVEEAGAVGQLSDLAGRFPAKSVVLFSNERDEPYVVATPLQYVFGIESFAANRSYPDLRNPVIAAMVGRWRKQGYAVYVLMGANGGKLNLPGYSLKPLGEWDYRVPELEQLYYQKPANISSAYLPWGIYLVDAAAPAPSLPFHLQMGEMDYSWLVSGFYTQERDGPGQPYWRWMTDHSIVRVPWPEATAGALQGRNLTLRLRPETPVAGKPVRRTQPVTVTVTVDGTRVGQVTVTPGSQFQDYSLVVPAGIATKSEDKGYALVTLTSPTWTGQAAGTSYDTRALGIQVESVELAGQ